MKPTGESLAVWASALALTLAPSGASPASGSVQPTPPRPPVKEGKRPPRLPISDSKTGYVENAIVGTQVRFRDDTAFGIDHPDRAEFFYGKCGCYRPTLDPLAPGPVPDTPSPPTRVIETGISFLDLRLNVEHAFGSRFSWFVEVPFRYLKPEVIDSAFGLADVQTGVKFAVVASDRRYLTLQLKGYLPTGEALHGLGTGHASLEPALLYLDKLSEHLTLETELAYWHPTSGSSADGVFVPTGESSRDSAYLPVASDRFFGDVVRYGVGLSYKGGSDWTPVPVVELVGWKVLGGFATVSDNGVPVPPRLAERADGLSILNLKVGLRVGPAYVGYGRALTREIWYNQIFRVELRFSY